MINILLPMAGKSMFFDGGEYVFPKPLIEIKGIPMIQHVVDNLNRIAGEKQFIFLVNGSDCSKFHLDSTLRLIAGESCKIIPLDHETKGAACSCLMAISHINNDEPLIISNSDQIFDIDLNEALAGFRAMNLDAAVLTFNSVHPRWSYIQLDEQGNITETAEKKPLSRNAIAGFYYFKHGRDFIRAAMASIEKDANVNGIYYVAPVLNEFILENKKVGHVQVPTEKYHTFYSAQKVEQFK